MPGARTTTNGQPTGTATNRRPIATTDRVATQTIATQTTATQTTATQTTATHVGAQGT